jgi:preprotein translocase subunit YajC
MFFLNEVSASEAVQGAAAGGGWQMMIPLLVVFTVMYFLVVRPQNKRAKDQASMQSAVKVGNHVLTSGGRIGRVIKAEEKELRVEFSAGSDIRVVRTAILGIVESTSKEASSDRSDPKGSNGARTHSPKNKPAKQ